MKLKALELKKASDVDQMQVPFEVKEMDDTDPEFFIIKGLASTFGNVDLVGDIVERGAFKESISITIPVILWQHKQDHPIGMPGDLFESEEGLDVTLRLPKADTFVSGRVIPQIKVGSIQSMSIGYKVDDFEMQGDIRLLKKVTLKEISLVTFPANPQAKVTDFKGDPIFYDVDAAKKIKNQREFEAILRESGLFSKAASVIMANSFVIQGEPDDQEAAKAVAELSQKMVDNEALNYLLNLNNKLEN